MKNKTINWYNLPSRVKELSKETVSVWSREDAPFDKDKLVTFEGELYISLINKNSKDIADDSAWGKIKGEEGPQGPKGDTFTYEDMTPDQLESLKGDVISYNSLSESEKQDLADRVPVNGVVEEGNTQAVSGGEVYDSAKNFFVFKDFNQLEVTNISSYTSSVKTDLAIGTFQSVIDKNLQLNPNAGGTNYIGFELKYLTNFKILEFKILERRGADTCTVGVSFGNTDSNIGVEYSSNGSILNTVYSSVGRTSTVSSSGKATFTVGDILKFVLLDGKIDIYKNNEYQFTKVLVYNSNEVNITSYGRPVVLISSYEEDTSFKDFIESQSSQKESIFTKGSEAYNDNILTDAIEQLEWFDKNYKSSNVAFYGLGNYYLISGERRTYLAFKDFKNISIFPIGWTDIYVVDSEPRKGLEKFLLKRSRNNDNDIVGSIIINWDKIPSGYRNLESNNYTNNSKLNNQSDDLLRIKKQLKRPYVDGDYSKWLDFDKVTGNKYMSGTSAPLLVTSLNDLYSKWDEFLNYNFVTKSLMTDLVPSADGNVSMWYYKFAMPNNRSIGDNYPIYRPKIVMTLSLHAFEKMPAICMYELMKDICENYNQNDVYADLLFNFDIIIIPSANPGMWNALNFAGTRTNFNGVDLNRNFPYYWLSQGAGTETWGGNSPLSEIESQKISELLLSIPEEERFLFIDFHNFAGSESDAPDRHMMLYFTPQDESAYYFCKNLVTTFTKKLQFENTEVPQNWDFQAGYSGFNYQRSQGGYLDVYGYSLGYYSTTAEVSRFFRWDGSSSYSDKCVNYGIQSIANYIRLAVKNQSNNIV